VRGDLLVKLGRGDEARAEFQRAAELTCNECERDVLLARARDSRHREEGATQIQAVEHLVRMAIGDDMTMVFDPTSTKPITIFDKNGNIVKVFEPKPGQTSRDVLIELLTGQQTP
jgi:hypothetical protein